LKQIQQKQINWLITADIISKFRDYIPPTISGSIY
jgi:hypothetical protein